ncbi:phosphopantetheine-binding protein, partial [Frankia sp. AiPs1]|uniref:phosphopantetheine-binding protein n=1 Tax=Frankia sp. AiPs1 TaxID=573493 RepID=UPI00204496E2
HLGEAAAGERPRVARDLVRDAVAEVLGYPAGRPLPTDRGLLDLGLDSLTAVELRNRIGAATGLRLPTTLLFDRPTIDALAEHLRAELAAALPGGAADALTRLADLEAALAALDLPAERPGDELQEQLAHRLSSLLTRIAPDRTAPDRTAPDRADRLLPAARAVDVSSDDELFALIDGQLGSE